MKLRHIALALGFFAAFASHAAAQDCQQWTIRDTPPLDRIVFGPLTADDDNGVKFSGAATLYLQDGAKVSLEVRRKLRKKKGTWKYKLKTPKRTKPKFKCIAEVGGDPEEVLKVRLKLKGEEKVKMKDAAKVTLGPCPSAGKSWNFTVGPAGGSFDTADGNVSLFFPVNSVTEDTTITVTSVATPPGTDFVDGTKYRFEPEVSFLQPVDLTISYDEAAITGDENDLRLGKLLEGDPAEGNQRLCTHSGVDTVNNRVTGFVTGLSDDGVSTSGIPLPLLPPGLAADVNPDRSVTLTWSSIPQGLVVLERTRAIVKSDPNDPNYRPCPSSHPSCIWDGSYWIWNGLQPPRGGDWAAGPTWVIGAQNLTWTDHATKSQMGVYYYRIRAFDGTTQSDASQKVRAIVFGAAAAPEDPDLTATAFTCGGIALHWSHVLEAEYYRIERKGALDPSHLWQVIHHATGTELHHVDPDAAPSTDLVYRVIAGNTAGYSPGVKRASVTSSDTEYTVKLSHYRPTIAPGETVKIEAEVKWLGPANPLDPDYIQRYDVTLSAAVDSTRLTADFFPPSGTTQDMLDINLTVAADAPCGQTINVDLAASDAKGGTNCPIPTVCVTVEKPPATVVDLTLTSLEPSSVDTGQPFELQLIGTGFTEDSDVHVGDVVVGTYYVSETELFALGPPLTAGPHMVKVVNPDGAESNELQLNAN